MPIKAGKYLGGVRDLEDLRQRCRMKEDNCWEWGGCTSSNKRPSVSMLIDGKRTNMNGRRASLVLAGPVPKNKIAVATLKCTNRLCVNPAHAEWLTVSQFRQRIANNATPEMKATWLKNGLSQGKRLSKLTVDQVREIRASDLKPQELAAKYGICFSNVHRILSGQAWRDVSGAVQNSSVFNWRPAA